MTAQRVRRNPRGGCQSLEALGSMTDRPVKFLHGQIEILGSIKFSKKGAGVPLVRGMP